VSDVWEDVEFCTSAAIISKSVQAIYERSIENTTRTSRLANRMVSSAGALCLPEVP